MEDRDGMQPREGSLAGVAFECRTIGIVRFANEQCVGSADDE